MTKMSLDLNNANSTCYRDHTNAAGTGPKKQRHHVFAFALSLF
jgi:hypothetical protein